jgi:hypothetical protein
MVIASFRLWLIAGAICLTVTGGLALATGHLSTTMIEVGLILSIIAFVFCAWIGWTISYIEDGY